MNRSGGQDRSARETVRAAARVAAMSTIREAIERVAAEVYTTQTREEQTEGLEGSHQQLDEALAGVGAARLAAHVAAKLLRDYALDARAAGRSWGDVAAALELPDHSDHSTDADAGDPAGESGAPRAETAFEWLIEDQPPPRPHREWWQLPLASWRCSTCRHRVLDRGPFESHPDDREHGHAADCARRRAALEAWRREQDEPDQGGHEHTDEHDDVEQEQDQDDEAEPREGGGTPGGDGGGGRR